MVNTHHAQHDAGSMEMYRKILNAIVIIKTPRSFSFFSFLYRTYLSLPQAFIHEHWNMQLTEDGFELELTNDELKRENEIALAALSSQIGET